MNYTQLVDYIQDLIQINASNTASFDIIFPAALNDAEGRIYRELDFLATRAPDSSTTFTPNQRTLTIPSTVLIVQGVSAITPAGVAPDQGSRQTLEPVSIDFIDYTWPTAAGTAATGIPEYFAMLTPTTMVVAPTPADIYTVEITGIFRPATLSSVNASNYLSETYPDLLLAAVMVFMTAYQRQWGSGADDPAMGVTWEAHYQTLKMSTAEEEQRRKHQSTGWSPYSAAPMSMPQRS